MCELRQERFDYFEGLALAQKSSLHTNTCNARSNTIHTAYVNWTEVQTLGISRLRSGNLQETAGMGANFARVGHVLEWNATTSWQPPVRPQALIPPTCEPSDYVHLFYTISLYSLIYPSHYSIVSLFYTTMSTEVMHGSPSPSPHYPPMSRNNSKPKGILKNAPPAHSTAQQ